MDTRKRVLAVVLLTASALLAAGALVSVHEDPQGGLRFGTVFTGRRAR